MARQVNKGTIRKIGGGQGDGKGKRKNSDRIHRELTKIMDTDISFLCP